MHPLTRCRLACGMAGALLAGSAAQAAPAARVDVGGGPLREALAELARENGVEILFTDSAVQGRTARRVQGRFTPEQALSILLGGTGMGYRAAEDGAFVLTELPRRALDDAGDGAIAEVLVVGRRTQNADIRRTENDIQPYRIIGPRELALAPRDSLDQLLRGRVPQNAQVVAPSQNVPAGAYVNSAIDLRGVGTQRTLVLIDGRRLPSLPTAAAGLEQGDLNALPLGAIERIETLTATAGGIHGLSAIGGAVNVILRRDYRGAELTVASGLTDRGDAGRTRLEGRLGFTPDEGRTDVMLFASLARARPLYVSDRVYGERALALATSNNPAAFVQRGFLAGGVIVRSASGRPLRLDPALGGATLDSSFTFAPLDASGDLTSRAAALVANSGQLPSSLPPEGAGERTSLLPASQSGSVLLNVRHRISDRLEAFADGFHLSNRGRIRRPFDRAGSLISANAPGNPFTEDVIVAIPTPDLYGERSVRTEAQRFTGGAIAKLPWRWQAAADYAVGRAVVDSTLYEDRVGSAFLQSLRSGLPGPSGLPTVDPFGDFAAFRAAARAHAVEVSTIQRLTTRFREASLRAAGPLLDLPGGPLTLTLLGDLRRERIVESASFNRTELNTSVSTSPERTQDVRSAYAELRAPLVPQDSPWRLARGLELQLARRRDHLRTTFPQNTHVNFLEIGEMTIRHRADVFTFGGRVFPAPWLMLRGSVATGQAPPDLRHLQERAFPITVDQPGEFTDPKRAGRRITQDGPYLWVRNGYHGIQPEKGRTISAGVVLNPSGRSGPRLSIDYSRVDVRDEIIDLRLGVDEVIAGEHRFPGRVVREPLSAADAALGYTGGRITAVHTGMINAGRLTTETVDVQLDWLLPPTLIGDLRTYGAVTWQPSFRRRVRESGALLDLSDFQDTPLEWRGNAGVTWARGPLSLDLNVQYFHSHSLDFSPASVVRVGAERIAFQGATHVPSHAYVDLTARRRFELPPDSPIPAIEVRLGVQNLLDRRAPVIADPNQMGYDYYGDPRGRRFEVLLTARF